MYLPSLFNKKNKHSHVFQLNFKFYYQNLHLSTIFVKIKVLKRLKTNILMVVTSLTAYKILLKLSDKYCSSLSARAAIFVDCCPELSVEKSPSFNKFRISDEFILKSSIGSIALMESCWKGF